MRPRTLLCVAVLGSSSPFASACSDTTPPAVAPITTVMLDGGVGMTAAVMPVDPPDGGVDGAQESAEAPSSGDFASCSTDSDCVRVPRNGCCNNGFMEAVNKNQVDAYKASFTCGRRRPCPMFRIREMRVPQCSVATHKCVLVVPDGGAPGFAAP